jgi:hypothetical protein
VYQNIISIVDSNTDRANSGADTADSTADTADSRADMAESRADTIDSITDTAEICLFIFQSQFETQLDCGVSFRDIFSEFFSEILLKKFVYAINFANIKVLILSNNSRTLANPFDLSLLKPVALDTRLPQT